MSCESLRIDELIACSVVAYALPMQSSSHCFCRESTPHLERSTALYLGPRRRGAQWASRRKGGVGGQGGKVVWVEGCEGGVG